VPRHAEKFQTQLMVAGRKPATINNRLDMLSSFSRWLVANQMCPAHFTATVRTVPVPKRARLRIPVTEFQRLLDMTDRPDRRIAVALGLFLFVRSGEMQTLRVGDVDLQQGTVSVVVHKTNDFDEMPICAELDVELRQWLMVYAHDIGRPLHPGDYLVPGSANRPGWMERPEVGNYRPDRIMRKPFAHIQPALKACGYEVRAGEGMHTLRRSGARALYDALVEGRIGDPAARDDALRQVMTMLHHASVQTTEHYIGLERDRQKRDLTIKGKSFLPKFENVTELRRVEGK
jgi:integrase